MREFVEITKAVGKTIEGVSDTTLHPECLITFTDCTYTSIMARSDYEDAALHTEKLDMSDLPRSQAIKLGVATEKEFIAHEEALAREWLKRNQDHERKLYLRLKAKFEGGK
jgi:hypothetical protein